MLSACGLQPMYAGGGSGAVAQGLAAIEVPAIEGRSGWLVAPSAGPLSPHWLDLAALVAVVGLSGAWCLWRQRGVPAFAVGDPFLAEGISYRSPT